MTSTDTTKHAYVKDLDANDPLKAFRKEFLVPTRGQLKRKRLLGPTEAAKQTDDLPCTYMCGNSLGLQPHLTVQYTNAYHQTWATKGVYGHFTELEDSPLVPWLHVDDNATPHMSAIVGAHPDEVAVMQTLTANLHLALASFYRPDKKRYKIIIESKAFPSDHYAVESQVRHHNLDPADAMITLEPSDPTKPTLSTEQILSEIDKHASTTAVLLLPGIQFYTGQFFDIPTITAHAQKQGIAVGWDLAHAVGNVPLHLHDWNVDFAVWCNYKYMNCGPGAVGGLFVHERHSSVSESDPKSASTAATASSDPASGPPGYQYRPRLSGWWGSTKQTRFAMQNNFTPIPGAAGWQLSNPSVADMTAVRASLDVFKLTSMAEIRAKSVKLTAYLEELLDQLSEDLTAESKSAAQSGTSDGKENGKGTAATGAAFTIITPRSPEQRGAQLSLRLAPGMMDTVMHVLEEESVVVDERRPDVIRVAAAPLYNTFADVLRFVKVFGKACRAARGGAEQDGTRSIMVGGKKDEKGWSEVK